MVARKYCWACKRWVAAEGTGFPHLAHLFLTFVTCGIWSIVWALCWQLDAGIRFNCRQCGSKCS